MLLKFTAICTLLHCTVLHVTVHSKMFDNMDNFGDMDLDDFMSNDEELINPEIEDPKDIFTNMDPETKQHTRDGIKKLTAIKEKIDDGDLTKALNILSILKNLKFIYPKNLIVAIKNKILVEQGVLQEIHDMKYMDETKPASISSVMDNQQTPSKTFITSLKGLSGVAGMLSGAYAGCKGHSCSTLVLDIQFTYQNLLQDTYLSTYKFTVTSLTAVRNMIKVKRYMDYGRMKIAVKKLFQSRLLVDLMLEITEVLIVKSQNLIDTTQDIAKTTHDDQLFKATNLTETTKLASKLNVDLENTRQAIERLEKQIKIDREDLKKAEQRVSDETQRSEIQTVKRMKSVEHCHSSGHWFWKRSSCSYNLEPYYVKERVNVCNPVTLKSYIEAKKKLYETIKERDDKVLEQQELMGKLGAQLITANEKKNYLSMASISLDLSYQALIDAKTAFMSLKEFWNLMKIELEQINEDYDDLQLVLEIKIEDIPLLNSDAVSDRSVALAYIEMVPIAMRWIKIGYYSYYGNLYLKVKSDQMDAALGDQATLATVEAHLDDLKKLLENLKTEKSKSMHNRDKEMRNSFANNVVGGVTIISADEGEVEKINGELEELENEQTTDV